MYEDGNYTKAKPLLDQFKLDHIKQRAIQVPPEPCFGANLMFSNPFLRGLNQQDFDEEGGQIDGTLAHSIERLIGLSTTEIYKKKLLTTYSGYALSKQHLTEKLSSKVAIN